MVGMRNAVIHNYFGVDENVIWQTIHDALPRLNKVIDRTVKNLESGR